MVAGGRHPTGTAITLPRKRSPAQTLYGSLGYTRTHEQRVHERLTLVSLSEDRDLTP